MKTTWNPKRRVWFQKNDDGKLAEASENISDLTGKWRGKKAQKEIQKEIFGDDY